MERGGGSRLANIHAISGVVARYPSTGLAPGYFWRMASSSRKTVFTAHVASSFWSAAVRVVGLGSTAIGARIGFTAFSSWLSRTLLQVGQRPSSSTTLKLLLLP